MEIMGPCERWGLTPEQSAYAEGLARETGVSLEYAAQMVSQILERKPLWHNSAK
jgi:hypothetical protein